MSGGDPESIARSIAGESRSLLHSGGAALAVRLDDSSFRLIANAGTRIPDSIDGRLDAHHSLSRTALRTSRASSFAATSSNGISSYPAAVAPIVHEGCTVGALFAINRPGEEPFSRE